VEKFTTGRETKERLHRPENGASVGVAIIEMALPDMTGTALAEHIQNNFRHVVIVHITEDEPPVIMGTRVFPKPISNPEEFCNFIWSLLKTAAWKSEFSGIQDKLSEVATKLGEQCSVNRKACQESVGAQLKTLSDHSWGLSWARMQAVWRVMVYVLLGLVGYFFYDFHAEMNKVTDLRIKVGAEIEPAIKEVRQQQQILQSGQEKISSRVEEVLRRIPITPSPSIKP
jgi:CheY-like chemotaxis protein